MISQSDKSIHPPLILTAGMPRSGSTWLYNAVRLILESHRTNFTAGWIDDCYDKVGRVPLVMKLHHFDEELAQVASLIFYSYRDIRDAMASSLRKFSRQPSIAQAQQLIDNYQNWQPRANYVLRYESMATSPLETLCDIAAVLGYPDTNIQNVQAKITQLNYDSDGMANGTYNTLNLLHKGHITSGQQGSWQSELPEALAQEVEETLGFWLKKHGYPMVYQDQDSFESPS